MTLLDIYERYKKVNNDYSKFIEKMVNKEVFDFESKDEFNLLEEYNMKIQQLKSSIESIESTDSENIKDLNYLIVDLMFLSVDLMNFYNCREVERFKMRAINYINKQRRKEFFGSN
ncbi:hypothetical protein [Clostridium massiliamazoniense]|uniref:hypothetical protein n=1 Tax=Clostridium massiliamazoniense TaxID=1347366 RepID=UPI0006D8102E|nr:hypothetical protein [Clostridium massiliamazoniense]